MMMRNFFWMNGSPNLFFLRNGFPRSIRFRVAHACENVFGREKNITIQLQICCMTTGFQIYIYICISDNISTNILQTQVYTYIYILFFINRNMIMYIYIYAYIYIYIFVTLLPQVHIYTGTHVRVERLFFKQPFMHSLQSNSEFKRQPMPFVLQTCCLLLTCRLFYKVVVRANMSFVCKRCRLLSTHMSLTV